MLTKHIHITIIHLYIISSFTNPKKPVYYKICFIQDVPPNAKYPTIPTKPQQICHDYTVIEISETIKKSSRLNK